jgi:tetratricopeptide (TPR) repeat protein
MAMVSVLINLYYKVWETKPLLRNGIIIITLLAIAGYGYGTHQRNKVWKTDEALWKDVTEKSPNNGRGWMNYGLTQMSKGNYNDALYAYEQALTKTPRYYILHINMGVLKAAMGLNAEAEQYYKNAINYGANHVEPYYYYARFLFNNGRIDEAEIYCGKALSIFSGHIYSRYLQMDIYNYKKDWNMLLASAQTTLTMYPSDAKAQTYLHIAQNPSSANVPAPAKNQTAQDLLNQSLAYYHAGKFRECIDACLKALQLQPGYAEAYNNICTAYNQLQQFDSAIWACNKAIELKPDFQLAKNNLNWAKSQLKK